MSSSLGCRECAEILEHMKQLGEAGQLYEAAQYYDKADTPHLDQQFFKILCCFVGSGFFVSLGSGSVSTRYGSRSFYHQAKIVRKTMILSVMWLLYDFLSLEIDVNVASKSK
jgi:hypothetical protein